MHGGFRFLSFVRVIYFSTCYFSRLLVVLCYSNESRKHTYGKLVKDFREKIMLIPRVGEGEKWEWNLYLKIRF